MGTDFDNLQRRLWQQQQRELMEEYEAVQAQLGIVLEAAQQVRLRRQAQQVEVQIRALDEKLGETAVSPTPQPQIPQPIQPQTIALADSIRHVFSKSELHELYFRLGINPDDIAADTLPELARELVLLMQRRGQLPALLIQLKQLRPAQNWELT